MSASSIRLYGGEVELRFEPAEHAYFVQEDGERRRAPSVTQILGVISKRALVQWAANCAADSVREAWKPGESYDEIQIGEILQKARFAHREVSGRAKDIGSLVHKWIEDYLSSHPVSEGIPILPVNPETRRACLAAVEWMQRVNFSPVLTESRIYSRQWGYAGTQDSAGALARVGEELAVVDWKSSKAVYAEYRLQLAAYAKAHAEMTGEEIRERWVVRLDKETGEVEPVRLEPETLEKDFLAFLGALALWRRLDEIEFDSRNDGKRRAGGLTQSTPKVPSGKEAARRHRKA